MSPLSKPSRLLLVLLLLCTASGFSCKPHLPGALDETSPMSRDLAQLTEWMIGSFSSQSQAEADEDYFDIRLEVARIWHHLEGGVWLYVEQAAASSLERPYRQRVYFVSADERLGTLVSEIFTLPGEPLDHAGAWREGSPLSQLKPRDLIEREGCAVTLKRAGAGRFEGSTDGANCSSSLRGAQYATSHVTIDAKGMESWDRGFDDSGEQVWGAEKGPYVFLRR